MTVTVEVNRMRVRARHGVMEQERIVGNDFEVTVRLRYPAAGAVATDDLSSTLNYAKVCATVNRVMQEPSALLERVCGRMRDALLGEFPLIEGGLIRVAKLAPPISGVQAESVAVVLEW